MWGIPGGSLEARESLEEGCAREYEEELGIAVRCRGLALVNEGFWNDGRTWVREYGFYFRIEPEAAFPDPPFPVEPRMRGCFPYMASLWEVLRGR